MSYEVIPDHPGFYRHGKSVAFRFRDQRGRRRWASASTIAAAKRKRAALETDVDRGEYRESSRLTFSDYAERWVETYTGRTARGFSEATREEYRRALRLHAIPYFGSMQLAAIEPQDVKAFHARVAKRMVKRAGKSEPVAADTVRLALAPLKALFATAYEEGAIRRNPAAGVRVVVQRETFDERGEPTKEPVKALTSAELAALLSAIPGADKLLCDFLADTGLRWGEAVELRWRDLDLGGQRVRVQRAFRRGRNGGRVGPPKSRYGRRTLSLTTSMATRLWQSRKETKAPDSALVFSRSNGERLSYESTLAMLKTAAREADVGDWVGFHTFRHTCATTLFRGGWNPKQVQRWLGHHSASFTLDTYIHLLEDDIPDAVAICATNPATTTAQTRPNSEADENVKNLL